MKVYIAGKITNEHNYKEIFKRAEEHLIAEGKQVINPAVLPEGFGYEDYMHICFAMIDVCDMVFMLDNWKSSKGATAERDYALQKGKLVAHDFLAAKGRSYAELRCL